MKKIRIQFIVFFICLSLGLGVLLFYSYEQMNREEEVLWSNIAENVFNQMQSQVSNFLLEEDQRSFSEYRYYYIPETQIGKTLSLNISPLASLPTQNERGLVGHFQIDPDGSFHTPYVLNHHFWKPLPQQSQRQQIHNELRKITFSFQQEVFEDKNQQNFSTQNLARPQFKSIELGDFSHNNHLSQKRRALTTIKPKINQYQHIYPNPILERNFINRQKILFKNQESQQDQITQEFLRQKLTKEVTTTSAQSATFQNQMTPETSENPAKKQSAISEKKIIDKNKVHQPLLTNQQLKQQSIFIDPFRARFIPKDETIIFYRKVWVDQKIYIQGFVVDLKKFFSWLMDLSFANSHLPKFAQTKLHLEQKVLAHYGNAHTHVQKQDVLFQRNLGYPLNLFTWKVYAKSVPHLSARLFLDILALAIILILTLGLYFIYKTAASQVMLSQKRQDFVSAVTHELKTPLTSLRLYSEMLENNWVNAESKKQEYYQLMNQESGRLSRLIDNVLQLARLEKKNYKLNVKTESPKKDFEKICQEIEMIVQKDGFEFAANSEENIAAIEYDPEALKQILLSLVENSLKFSKNAAEKIITLGLKEEKNNVIFTVCDKGPGIPTKHLKKVFQKFYRVENEMTRQTKGTGIGLAMAKMIMTAMSAEIEAANNKNGGLTISLIFEKATEIGAA